VTLIRDLLEDPARVASLPPDAIVPVLGELLSLLARLLIQVSTAPGTTHAKKPEDLDSLLTVHETATVLNLRPARVYNLVRRRALPAVRVGKYVRVRSRDLQAWIEAQREEGVDENLQAGLGFSPPMTRPSTKGRDKRSR